MLTQCEAAWARCRREQDTVISKFAWHLIKPFYVRFPAAQAFAQMTRIQAVWQIDRISIAVRDLGEHLVRSVTWGPERARDTPETTQVLGAELGLSQGSLHPVPCVFTEKRPKLLWLPHEALKTLLMITERKALEMWQTQLTHVGLILPPGVCYSDQYTSHTQLPTFPWQASTSACREQGPKWYTSRL